MGLGAPFRTLSACPRYAAAPWESPFLPGNDRAEFPRHLGTHPGSDRRLKAAPKAIRHTDPPSSKASERTA